jgi:NAD(P)H dehydrogenase (quinone)
MTIIVTSAAGQLGLLTAEHLLAGVRPQDLVLVTRSPDKLQRVAARGVAVRFGDFEEPASLPAAFAGGERLLIIGTHGRMERVAMHQGVIAAAKAAGIRHATYLSFTNPSKANPMFASETNRRIERALQVSGMDWTILRDAIYADLRVDLAPYCLATGKVVTNMGPGRHAYIWRDDCARCAAAILTGDEHEGQIYEATGPELLTARDYLDLIVEFGGRPVELVEIDDEAHLRYGGDFQERHGLPTWMPELHTSSGVALRGGHMALLTPVVQELTGHAPRSLRQMFEARRDEVRAVTGGHRDPNPASTRS